MYVEMIAGLWIPSIILLLLHRTVTNSEQIDSICRTANEYLDAMYRCRSSDFQMMSFCTSWSPHGLSCRGSGRIAILRASVGPSRSNLCTDAEHSSAVTLASLTDSGIECCFLPAVEAKCHGKTRCSLNDRDLLHSVEGKRCSYMNDDQQQQPLQLTVVFICVSQKIFREIKRDNSSPDGFCDGHLTASGEESSSRQSLPPADMVKFEGHSTTAKQFLRSDSASAVTSFAEMDESSAGDDSFSSSSSSAILRREGTIDWLWSLMFIKDHMDKFLIYLFLSVAVGIILVLVVVILGLCFGRCLRKRKSASKDVSFRTQSSTQTSDVNTSLIASNHTPGIEMVHYSNSDTLQNMPVTRKTGSPPSVAGNAVHFATGSDTDAPRLRGQRSPLTGNGRPNYQTLNLPQYQINASKDSVDSGGGGRAEVATDSEDYRSNTLGRFYTNPYRHDSYRADGYRTLQHK